jgi:PhnB protein
MEPTIYLHFKGNCREAMTLYAETLGGTVLGIFTNADAPTPEDRMPGGDHLVMNMAIRLGSATVMASDAPDAWYQTPQGFSVSITPSSMEEFDRIYAILAKDAGRIMMAPAETFWADRFAMFVDRFGTPWMLIIEGSKRAI